MFVNEDTMVASDRLAVPRGKGDLWLGYGRFLQVDPIGYEDALNLYTYVANDSVNKRDPTGTRCTGEGDQLACSIDQIETGGKPLTAAQTADIKAYNADYTASVRTLSSNPDRTVKISQDGKTFEVKAGDVAQTLRDRVFIAAPNGIKGQQVTGTTPDGTTTILGGAALAGKMDTINNASDDRRVTTVHEGIHRGPGENSVRPPFSNGQLNGAAHSLKWDNAARRLLGLPEVP